MDNVKRNSGEVLIITIPDIVITNYCNNLQYTTMYKVFVRSVYFNSLYYNLYSLLLSVQNVTDIYVYILILMSWLYYIGSIK